MKRPAKWIPVVRVLILTIFSGLFAIAARAVVPDVVKPIIPDLQDSQNPDRVHLRGWIGTRILANEANRLASMDVDRLLEGYRTRPGKQTWDGEHVGKWLHAATLAWVNTGDPKLRKRLDYVSSELVKCQLPDGYLGTYLPQDRWTQWDVWAHKYNLIGLVTYMKYTGSRDPLPACEKMADLLCRTFGDGPGQRDIIPAGQHMGMAPTSVLEPMVLLYRFTGEKRYLNFCKYILRAWEQPNGPKIVSTLLKDKQVDEVGDGKAYEMLSCLNGALEYYRTTGDRPLLQACLNAWDDIAKHQLYLTGASSYREYYHADNDLPSVNNVGETCVTVTWLQVNAQLLRLTGEARFADQLEKVVLNQLFGAQCPDGTAWGYYVQMQGKKPYSSNLYGSCCLSSGPRGIALIPTFAVTSDNDGVVVNLYEEGDARLTLRDYTSVALITSTKYPSDDRIHIKVLPSAVKTFSVKLRMPDWCSAPEVAINGKRIPIDLDSKGYLAVRREWKRGDRIDLRFKLEPRVVLGSHHTEGKLAVTYGPLVLAVDSALLPASVKDIYAVGVPGSQISRLKVKPEPAPRKVKTWPDARVFRINAVLTDPDNPSNKGKPFEAYLVPFADAGGTGSSYKVWLPYEALPADRNLLSDGIEIRSRKPNMGSILDGNLKTVAVTFNKKRAKQDWFGVELQEPAVISRVIFAHGKTFHDGGWFDTSAGKPEVQVQLAPQGTWTNAATLAKYPGTTARNPGGLKDGECFVCALDKPTEVYGVRVIGKPACGDNPAQAFASCAELQAYR